MSSALFEITVVAVRFDGATAFSTFRCRPLNTADDRAVTRSFVIRMLGVDSELGEAGPPAMVKAALEAGLQAWPEDPTHALRSYAPVIDQLVTATRLEPGDDAASFVVEAEFPARDLVAGLQPGQVFQTYAHDVWWEDPRNPLATEAEQTSWAAEVRRVLEADARREDAEIEQQSESVKRWLDEARAASMLAIGTESVGRVATKIAALILQAADPAEALRSIVDYLLDSPDVEEVFVGDHALLQSLSKLVC